jgi:hypothetical protein
MAPFVSIAAVRSRLDRLNRRDFLDILARYVHTLRCAEQ